MRTCQAISAYLIPSLLTGAGHKTLSKVVANAFLAAFDNYPIAIFRANAHTKTMPVQMIEFLEESPNPTIAAVSILLPVLTMAGLLVITRLVGLKRAASL
jgi:ABC-type spermidine/putrescine transport system permease subunit II